MLDEYGKKSENESGLSVAHEGAGNWQCFRGVAHSETWYRSTRGAWALREKCGEINGVWELCTVVSVNALPCWMNTERKVKMKVGCMLHMKVQGTGSALGKLLTVRPGTGPPEVLGLCRRDVVRSMGYESCALLLVWMPCHAGWIRKEKWKWKWVACCTWRCRELAVL